MTVARENRDNPLLYTMLIRVYIFIYLHQCLSTLQLRCIYAYRNISEICAHIRILRDSRNFFFCARGYPGSYFAKRWENFIDTVFFRLNVVQYSCWYYYSVFSRCILYCQIFSILYVLIVFNNFLAKIRFIKFLYISYCSIVLYGFFFYYWN